MVIHTSENPILGMSFMTAHSRSVDFTRPVLLKTRKNLLISSVQDTREMVILPRTKTILLCQVRAWNFCPLGLIG